MIMMSNTIDKFVLRSYIHLKYVHEKWHYEVASCQMADVHQLSAELDLNWTAKINW